MAWVEWKSSRLRELGWGTGYDTACASWSMPWLWGRSAWVERLDVVWESPVVWGIVKEDSALRLEFLFDVGKEVSTGLDWCSACGTQSRSDGLLKSSGWGGQENLPGQLDLGGNCRKSGFQVGWLEAEQKGPVGYCLAVVQMRGSQTKHQMQDPAWTLDENMGRQWGQ